jgi:hypothetical protein
VRPAVAIAIAAVAVRLVLRLSSGEDSFLSNGYTFYLTLATNFVAGEGLCYAPGEACALRMPLYPLVLAPFVAIGAVYPGVVILQALLGGLLSWIAWWLGRQLFNERAGVVAAVLTAFNPYAVIHDTALQETALLNVLVAGGLAAALRTARTGHATGWIASGLLFAAAALTSGRLVSLLPFVVLWVAIAAPRRAARAALLVALPIVLLLGGWVLRNWAAVGAPVLSTESGESLYLGNSALTFRYFPTRSIDLTKGESDVIPASHRDLVERATGREVFLDRLYREWAFDYITAHPAAVARGGLRKLWVVASAELSPAREQPWLQWGYRAFFLPLHLLALIGAWRVRDRAHLLIAACVISFAITTAVFWAHTSHKSYVDVLIFIYAAAGALRLVTGTPQSTDRRPASIDEWPRISIVIPSRDQGAFLEQAIRSVLEQRYPNLELLVIDGASTDESREVLARLAPQLAYCVSEPDEGPADALRKGFAHATGDVLGFLNADDFLLPGALVAVGSAFARDRSADVIAGHGYYAGPAGDLALPAYSDQWSPHRFAYGACVLFQPATFFRRAAFDRAGGIRRTKRVCWDMELWADLARTGATFQTLDARIAAFRIHSASITGGSEMAERRRHDARAVMSETRGRPEGAADRIWHLMHRLMKVLGHPIRTLRQRLFFRRIVKRWTL